MRKSPRPSERRELTGHARLDRHRGRWHRARLRRESAALTGVSYGAESGRRVSRARRGKGEQRLLGRFAHEGGGGVRDNEAPIGPHRAADVQIVRRRGRPHGRGIVVSAQERGRTSGKQRPSLGELGMVEDDRRAACGRAPDERRQLT